MAIERQQAFEPTWSNPVWPDPLPDPSAMRLMYSVLADELVELFDDKGYRDP
jgi:hypothetical protein